MKKIFLMTIVALCWLMMGSCSKGSSNNGSGSKDSCSESAEAAEAAAPGFENGVTYENEFWGFSVQHHPAQQGKRGGQARTGTHTANYQSITT